MKKIAVLFGGCSGEYSVSLHSAAAVIRHLDGFKYDVLLIGITRQGQWFKYGGSIEKIEEDTWAADESCVPACISPSREVHGVLILHPAGTESVYVDAVFPVMHGKNGEDGTLQGLLELAGIPFTGCGMLSSALCMDKHRAHQIAETAGVLTPKAIILKEQDDLSEALLDMKSFKFPLFVKPACSGSSLGITRAENEDAVSEAVQEAFRHGTKVLIEEAVEGFEVGCAILGNHTLTLGKVDEIELTDNFFDYTEKYTLKSAVIHMPARITGQKARQIKETAVVLYRALECRGFARVDLFLTPEGEIIFNEINTIPGFTAHSRYPSMLKGIGMPFEEILDKIIALALEERT